jgi:hypothetical protein
VPTIESKLINHPADVIYFQNCDLLADVASKLQVAGQGGARVDGQQTKVPLCIKTGLVVSSWCFWSLGVGPVILCIGTVERLSCMPQHVVTYVI